jgi:hypothetical protein
MRSGIVSVCVWWVLLFAMTAMTGCSSEGNPAQGSRAGRAGSDLPILLEMYGEDELGAIRVATDTARNRLWMLGLDHVRVYDTVTNQLIRRIALPGWSVMRYVCDPYLVLDRSGSAFISSNVQPKLWRIDADSFEVTALEVILQGNEQWDTGFGPIVFTAGGTLYALTASAHSLWKIDVAKSSASMIERYHPPLKTCALTAQFVNRLERSRKP